MGKAARNEKKKLKATFYNNLAVGATMAGFIVPLLAYARELLQRDDEFTTTEMIVTCGAMLVAALVAVFCRAQATWAVSEMED